MRVKIPVEISARHIHLCKSDLATLFGKGCRLTKQKELTQPGQFAAEETVGIRLGDKEIPNVRVVSPLRSKTQVEISLTDAYNLGLRPVVRASGDLQGTPGILLIGPKAELALRQGVMVALRHLHASPAEAKKFGLKSNGMVAVRVRGKRAVTFHNVRVRVKNGYKLSMHVDTDEGNAAGITSQSFGELIL